MPNIADDFAAIRARQAEIKRPKAQDFAVGLVEQFLPLYENYRAVEATLGDAYDAWEGPRVLGIPAHPDTRLLELLRQRAEAEKALGKVEERMLSTVPTSPAGVAALIRAVIAYTWDHEDRPEDQGPEVRALRLALAYFGQDKTEP